MKRVIAICTRQFILISNKSNNDGYQNQARDVHQL